MANGEAVAFLKRHFDGVAYLAEVSWNLREWIREAAADPFHGLDLVLQSRLSHVRSQLVVKMLDSGLSQYTPSMPSGKDLTATSMVTYIESLRFPGGAQIKAPTGKPPLEWPSLTRYRALRLAAQLCNEDGELLLDPNNPSDLRSLETLDPISLIELWEAAEDVCSPRDEAGRVTPARPTGQPDTKTDNGKYDDETEWSRPMTKKEAARILGCRSQKKAAWINDCVGKGILVIREINRTQFEFELSHIDAKVRNQFRRTDAT